MKKIGRLVVASLTGAMLIMGLTACDSSATYLNEISPSKYVTLGDYVGVEVSAEEPNVNEETVQAYIDYLLNTSKSYEPVEGKTVVEDGDIVDIDYAGFKGEEQFEGGTAQGSHLTIGSGQFIDGFEAGLIGHSVGEEVELNLTFPEGYQNADLAGADVVFKVTINSIVEEVAPELTDEFAASQNIDGVTTVQEYRDFVYNTLYDQAASSYSDKIETSIIETVMANSTFEELPEGITTRYEQALIDSFTSIASSYGMDLPTYMLNYYNLQEGQYLAEIKIQAVTTAQQYLMYAAIAEKEGITLSDEEFNTRMQEMADGYGSASLEEFLNTIDAGTYREYLLAEKVMDFLKENANITATPAQTTSTDAE